MKILNNTYPKFNAHQWIIFKILKTNHTVCYVPHLGKIFNIEAEGDKGSRAYWYVKDLLNIYENS